jgi:hypothetical protein
MHFFKYCYFPEMLFFKQGKMLILRPLIKNDDEYQITFGGNFCCVTDLGM